VDIDGDTVDDCSTAAGEPATCSLAGGATFTLEVSLNSLPAGVPNYEGFDILLEYGGVSSKDNASAAAWPDCAFPASFFEPGLVALSCAAFTAPSTYTGLIGTNEFNCTESGSITMAGSQEGETGLSSFAPVNRVYQEGTDETLTINCVEAPIPIPTVPPVGGLGVFPDIDETDPSGRNTALVPGIAAVAAACAIALCGAAWYGRRRVR
jgi:hypothetical protein